MKHYKTISWAASVTVSCLLFFALYRFASQLFIPKTISFSFDHQFSDATKKQCAALIKKELPPLYAATLKNNLKPIIPALKSLTLRFSPAYSMHVKVYAQQPLITINNKYVLATDGTLIDQKHFEAQVLERLPALNAHPDFEISTTPETEMADFVSALPRFIFEQYTIIWHNKTYILLEDKRDDFTILALHTTRFDENLLNYIAQIKNIIEEKKALRPAKKTQKSSTWQADVRFRDQIVLSHTERRGGV